MAKSKKTKKAAVKKVAIKKEVVKKTPAPKASAAKKCPCYEKIKAFFTEDRKKLIFAFVLGALCVAFIWSGFSIICEPQKPRWERKGYSKVYREQKRKAFPAAAMGCKAGQECGCMAQKGMKGAPGKTAPAGCPIEADRRSKYIESEYAPYLKPGSAQIIGTVVQKARPGGKAAVPTIEGFEVFANPVTSYSQEWFVRNWAGNENLKTPDSRAWRTNFKAQVARDGSFVLKDLPKGEYFVAARGCVKFDPKQEKCVPMRYGKRVRVDDGQRSLINLDIVSKGR